MDIVINSIRWNNSLVDGPGIRTVLFMQGCDIRCKGCHNTSAWDIKDGTIYQVDKLVDILTAKTINKKITISGGEPLFQLDSLKELVKLLSSNGFDIALYTGHKREDVPSEILEKIKYLKTGPFEQDNKTTIMPYVGSSNQQFEEI